MRTGINDGPPNSIVRHDDHSTGGWEQYYKEKYKEALERERLLLARLSQTEWREIVAENQPPAQGKWLGWNPLWGDRVMIFHYDCDGDLCGQWAGPTMILSPGENPSHWSPITAPKH